MSHSTRSNIEQSSAVTRRRFLAVAGAAALTAVSSRSSFSQDAANSKAASRKPEFPYIDVHTHIGTTWNGNKELTPKGLLEWMDEHGVEKSVLLPLTSPESSSFLLL